jgi:hypothetical protein
LTLKRAVIGRRAPDRHPIVATMVVVEVADRPPITDEEARCSMTDPLGDPGQCQGDLSDQTKEVTFIH